MRSSHYRTPRTLADSTFQTGYSAAEPEGSGVVVGVLVGLCLWAVLAVVWVVLQ